MPPDTELEEDYLSEEDSDFAPEEVQEGDASASEDEGGDGTKRSRAAQKRQAGELVEEDAGFDNSGDEGIIEKGKKRRKKGKEKDGEAGVEVDEDGEGGLIKTRSMRATEKAERRAAAVSGPVTIDVDSLWAQMTSDTPAPAASQDGSRDNGKTSAENEGVEPPAAQKTVAEQSDMIRIKRTYNFAGRVQAEEKLVARDSAEAKLYLASLDEQAAADASVDAASATKRMPRRAFRSAFEPIVDQSAQRTDLNLGMAARLQLREQASKENAKKLNTVEKSRMDWAGYVDQEGIKDELELASKSKASYAARQDFLARSEAIRDQDARMARQAARTQG